MKPEEMVPERELITKFRAAIKDRATWFALLYREFLTALPADEVEKAARKAIYAYGRLKASRDGATFSAAGLLDNFVETGGAKIFEAQISDTPEGVLNKVHNCALVQAWEEMGCSQEEIELFCDIAMDGDRGRAEGHGLTLTLHETLAKKDCFCWIHLSDPRNGQTECQQKIWSKKMSNDQEMVTKAEMIKKIRAAIGDRATWFALLFDEFCTVLPEEEVIALCRKAITKYGHMKAKKDPEPFKARDWVLRHKEKGSADVFDSDIEYDDTQATQKMKNCALADAWKTLNYSPEKIDLFCDIAMDGDRGRAAGHSNITMELHETIGKGCDFCRLVIKEKKAD